VFFGVNNIYTGGYRMEKLNRSGLAEFFEVSLTITADEV
jgi:hypothetical protein